MAKYDSKIDIWSAACIFGFINMKLFKKISIRIKYELNLSSYFANRYYL